MERRIIKNRIKRRISVRFGQDAAEKIAFTEDISPTGIFIKTAYVIRPGSPIKIDLQLDGTATVQLEGTVVWAKQVPPNLIRLVHKCGMGIRITRFIEGRAGYLAMFP